MRLKEKDDSIPKMKPTQFFKFLGVKHALTCYCNYDLKEFKNFTIANTRFNQKNTFTPYYKLGKEVLKLNNAGLELDTVFKVLRKLEGEFDIKLIPK